MKKLLVLSLCIIFAFTFPLCSLADESEWLYPEDEAQFGSTSEQTGNFDDAFESFDDSDEFDEFDDEFDDFDDSDEFDEFDDEFDDFDEFDGDFEDFEDDFEDEDSLEAALEIYSWFVLYPLDVDLNKSDSTGQRWQVLDERFNTPESLRTIVEFYFSDEIADQLFSMGVYVEENGYLYCSTQGREPVNNIVDTELTVTEREENRIVYTLHVQYAEGSDPAQEDLTYVRELEGGEWRFTEFPFFL